MDDAQVAAAPEETGQVPSEEKSFDFREHIDESIRNDPSLKTYKDINGMAKSLINAQRMVGADKIVVPGSSATEDDWQQIYGKLGRPETADGYELSFKTVGEDNAEWFKNTAHSLGLSQQQATKLLDAYGSRMNETSSTSEEDLERHRVALETDLKKEWGDQFENNMKQANNVLDEFGFADLTEMPMADGKKLGDNPEVIKLFHSIGGFIAEKLGEDKFSGRDSEPNMSASDISTEIARLTAKGSPYWDAKHPEHDNYVQEAMRFRELIT